MTPRLPADAFSMRQRLVFVVLTALALAAADQCAKAVLQTHPGFVHVRSPAWAVLSVALLAGSLALALLPSRAVAASAGLLAGGVLGNLVSAVANGWRVPNPFVLMGGDGGIAFNLADVFVVAGILLQTAALARVTIRYRHVLPQSTVAARAFRALRRR